jgi:hypothetical protein
MKQVREKIDDSKDRFCDDLVHTFDHFPKYHMKILLGDYNAKVEREDIFIPTIGNESLLQDSNDNGVRIVNFATSKNLAVKSRMLSHREFNNYTGNSPDGKNHNQIYHILIDKRWHSIILDVRSIRRADCDIDHYLVVARFRERFIVSKQEAQNLGRKDLISEG